MKDKPKVMLTVAWLQENGHLEEAAKLLGYAIIPGTHTKQGVSLLDQDAKPLNLSWESDSFALTIAQLIELGFALGDLEYCGSCGKLKVDCDEEMAEGWPEVEEN